MSLQKVDELDTPPILGKYYLVPTIRAFGSWIPIVGNAHDDVELGIKQAHFHKDTRFLSVRKHKAVLRDVGCVEPYDMALIIQEQYTDRREVVYTKMRCNREQLIFPAIPDLEKDKNFPRFERIYMDKKLSKCQRCPHRGIDLRSIPADGNGVKICPGHGLAWNVETGALVPRYDVNKALVNNVNE
jgi:hypothetical protein